MQVKDRFLGLIKKIQKNIKKNKKEKKDKKKRAHRLHRTDGDEDHFFDMDDEAAPQVGKKRPPQDLDEEEIGHHPRKRRHALEDDE
mmetsp:Transcript_34327/g.52597  ORF Transcript_34327/g.52597 Transcript_34327/m.52597 type:complete len:86 (-) Transcript_34327:158-415(-)